MIPWNQIIIMVLIVVSIDMKAHGQGCQEPTGKYVTDNFYPPSRTYQGEILFYLSKASYVNDVAAETACREICGNLVVVDSREKMNALISFVDNFGYMQCALIAGNDKKVTSTWVLGSGTTPIPYLKWGENQPNGCRAVPPGHHCLFLNKGYHGMLDLNCEKAYWECHFICEKCI